MSDNSLEQFWNVSNKAPIENPDASAWTASLDTGGKTAADATQVQAASRSDCQSATDCGSGHICVNGVCVEKGRSTPQTGASSGCGDGPGATGGSDPGGCADQGCNISGCGPGQPGPINCCGGKVYRHYPGGTESCDPPERPERGGGGGCSEYCTNYLHVHGEYDEDNDCSPRTNTCGMCDDCDGGYGGSGDCIDRSDAPCFCPGSECDGDCEQCNDDGECEKNCDNCFDVCNCWVTCSCGKVLKNDRYLRPHCENGPACASACRSDLHAKCADACAEVDRKRKDPCKADPEDPCEGECECKTWKLPCGTLPKDVCPAGHSCKSMGHIYMSACYEEDGMTCLEDPTCDIYYFVKVCDKRDIDKEECEGCDCNCEDDCPDCFKCNSAGECEPDPECEEVCPEDQACDESCCGEDQFCEEGALWRIKGDCHGPEEEIEVPASLTPKVTPTTTIPAESAVCSRWHTHGPIKVNGVEVGRSLDASTGIEKVGSTNKKCWPNSMKP